MFVTKKEFLFVKVNILFICKQKHKLKENSMRWENISEAMSVRTIKCGTLITQMVLKCTLNPWKLCWDCGIVNLKEKSDTSLCTRTE